MSERSIVQVRDVMRPDFDTIDSMASIEEALEKLTDTEASCLIVDKRDEHDEIGMLLISDIARQVLAKDRSPERVNVYEVMCKPVIAVEADMLIQYCASLFTRFDLSRAPVLENGSVVGIVSFTDLVIKGFGARR